MTDTNHTNNGAEPFVPDLTGLRVISNDEYWAIRMPGGDIRNINSDNAFVIRAFEDHLAAATKLGLADEFLASARLIRARRIFVETEWIPAADRDALFTPVTQSAEEFR